MEVMEFSATPRADVSIDAALIRRLLRDANLGDADPELIGSGFDNEMWRAGHIVLRLPRREVAAHLLRHEQRWLDTVTSRVTLETPTVIWRGEPNGDYPYPWLATTFIEGDVALRSGPLQSDLSARRLGEALVAIHQTAPHDAPMNPFRGVALSARAEHFAATNKRDGDGWLHKHFHHALRAPTFAGQPRWLHGDVHGGNLITRDGELVGLIDFGDMCGGDPACDLGGALLALHPGTWGAFTRAYHADGATWQRAFGWLSLFIAIHLSIGGRHAMAADATLRAWRAL